MAKFNADDYRLNHLHGRICKHCGSEFWPEFPTQRYCSREDNPACDDDRISARLWKQNRHPLQKQN